MSAFNQENGGIKMEGAVIFMGNVSAQLINIKKVSIDSELKVAVTIEFMATEEQSKENVFRLIQLQGDIAEMTVRPAQGELFDAVSKSAAEGGNGKKNADHEAVGQL